MKYVNEAGKSHVSQRHDFFFANGCIEYTLSRALIQISNLTSNGTDCLGGCSTNYCTFAVAVTHLN